MKDVCDFHLPTHKIPTNLRARDDVYPYLNIVFQRNMLYMTRYNTPMYALCTQIERGIFQLHGSVLGLLITSLQAKILPFKHTYPSSTLN